MESKTKWYKKLWISLVWFLTEMMLLWSDKPSFFSKKRVESSIAFLIAQVGMVWYFIAHFKGMDMYSLTMWATVEFVVAGYTLNQIQKEKRNTPNT